jgi:hypothetical protein
MEDKLIMKEVTKRSVFRWIHIVFGIPIPGRFGTLDVERPCPSTTYFEEIGKLLA